MRKAKPLSRWIQVKASEDTKKMLLAIVADETIQRPDHPSDSSSIVRILIRKEFTRRKLVVQESS